MFPNVRLMIVAVLASIMGISCALGLFAEFRVSHDSLLRESNAGSPLQFNASGSGAAVIDTAASFEVRFQAQPGPHAVIADNNPAADPTPATAGVTAAPVPQVAPAAAPAPTTNTPQSPVDLTASPPSPTPQETPNTASEAAIPVAAGSTTGQDSILNGQKDPESKVETKSIGTAPADSAPADAADGKPHDSKPADRADNPPAESRPADTVADRASTASGPVQETAPEPASSAAETKILPERAPAVVPKRHPTVRHRPLIARRVVPRARRTVSPAQSFTAAQPFYQWSPQPQPAQPVRRRLIVRRPRSPANAAETAQPTVSNTSVANAPK